MELTELSSQDRWYLHGNWPITTGVIGQQDVQPVEMKSLISKGLARESRHTITNKPMYILTLAGIALQRQLRSRTA